MRSPHAIIRCDASPSIGAGHVSRCLALAEALEEFGWNVDFVVSAGTTETVPALVRSGFRIRVIAEGEHELEAMRDAASGEAALVVVDQYERGRAFERECRSFASRVFAFDDAIGRNHDCDLLLDSGAADASFYAGRVTPQTTVLAGPAYALMRRSFIKWREAALARRDGSPVKSILVSCGATDPLNCTAAVLEALAGIAKNASITIALSSSAPHLDDVRQRLKDNMRLRLDVEDMAELLADADFAIGAPGASAFERAVLGLPSILFTFADNQHGVASVMTDAGAVIDAGVFDPELGARLRHLLKDVLDDGETRKRMAKAASTLIDGRGALRIMLALCGERNPAGAEVALRLAAADDEDWLLWLQSHPRTRQFFRNPAVPTAAEHHAWMQRVLSDQSSMLLIIEAEGKAVGMIRLDRSAKTNDERAFEISIVVDPARHGSGIGSAALRMVRRFMPNAVFDAAVHLQNAPSRALFQSAGFAKLSHEHYRSMPA